MQNILEKVRVAVLSSCLTASPASVQASRPASNPSTSAVELNELGIAVYRPLDHSAQREELMTKLSSGEYDLTYMQVVIQQGQYPTYSSEIPVPGDKVGYFLDTVKQIVQRRDQLPKNEYMAADVTRENVLKLVPSAAAVPPQAYDIITAMVYASPPTLTCVLAKSSSLSPADRQSMAQWNDVETSFRKAE